VVFALDTTGSMASLIEGAKSKIWSLANEIASGQPRPVVRFGLVGYRDLGDEYVTKRVALTEDMDAVYEQLMAFRADGGGDTPEHVNRALREAIEDMAWEPGQGTLKLIFLVGDAPPHDDYDEPTSRQLAARARDKGIVVNAVRAGGADDTLVAWQKIACIAGGEVASIAQTGGMVEVATPFDGELEQLNAELADTTLGYGSHAERVEVEGKKARRRAMKAEVAASAVSYSAKGSGGLGRGDLLGDLADGRVALDELEAQALPEPMQAMSVAERKAFVDAQQKRREQLRTKIAAASKQRDTWLKEHADAPADSFDRKVMGAVATQAAGIGVSF
jgi:hypothetical protein